VDQLIIAMVVLIHVRIVVLQAVKVERVAFALLAIL
jgi:hypothetical protein